ncbi:hypothetical protein MD484_g3105, partial [Candolleomyces efflorescens]
MGGASSPGTFLALSEGKHRRTGVLSRSRAALICHEVNSFTQNGGREKIDKLISLLCSPDAWFFAWFQEWIRALCDFTEGLQAQNSEAVTVINKFANKWRDYDEKMQVDSISQSVNEE